MKLQLNLDLENCRICPILYVEYLAHSRCDYICKLKSNTIILQNSNHPNELEQVSIPEWCPIRIKNQESKPSKDSKNRFDLI